MRGTLDGAIRVLIVDVDLEAATPTAMLLADFQCNVTLATNIEQAIRVATLLQPHLVLIRTDHVDEAIADAVARIRIINSKLIPRFGALLTQPIAASAHRCLQAGFDHVLNAPAEPDALEEVVASVGRHFGAKP